MIAMFSEPSGSESSLNVVWEDIRKFDVQIENMARQPEEPTVDQVRDELSVCEPYTVSDLADVFDSASRWTIQRRLDTLVDQGDLNKKKHAKNKVSYWVSHTDQNEDTNE
jgi:predicted HTH transcriptional regulator